MFADTASFQFVREAIPPAAARYRPREVDNSAATAFRASGNVDAPLYIKVENLEGALPLGDGRTDFPADISITCELRVGNTVRPPRPPCLNRSAAAAAGTRRQETDHEHSSRNRTSVCF